MKKIIGLMCFIGLVIIGLFFYKFDIKTNKNMFVSQNEAHVNFKDCYGSSYCIVEELKKVKTFKDYDVLYFDILEQGMYLINLTEKIKPIDHTLVQMKNCNELKSPFVKTICQYAARFNNKENFDCQKEPARQDIFISNYNYENNFFSPRKLCVKELISRDSRTQTCANLSDSGLANSCFATLAQIKNDQGVCDLINEKKEKNECLDYIKMKNLKSFSECQDQNCLWAFNTFRFFYDKPVQDTDCDLISNLETKKVCQEIINQLLAVKTGDILRCREELTCLMEVIDQLIYKKTFKDIQKASDDMCNKLSDNKYKEFCWREMFNKYAATYNKPEFCVLTDGEYVIGDKSCFMSILEKQKDKQIDCSKTGAHEININKVELQKVCKKVSNENLAVKNLDFSLCYQDEDCIERVENAISYSENHDFSKCDKLDFDYEKNRCKEKAEEQKAIENNDVLLCHSENCIGQIAAGLSQGKQLPCDKIKHEDPDRWEELVNYCQDKNLINKHKDDLNLAHCANAYYIASCVELVLEERNSQELNIEDCKLLNKNFVIFCKTDVVIKKNDISLCDNSYCIGRFFVMKEFTKTDIEKVDCSLFKGKKSFENKDMELICQKEVDDEKENYK